MKCKNIEVDWFETFIKVTADNKNNVKESDNYIKQSSSVDTIFKNVC